MTRGVGRRRIVLVTALMAIAWVVMSGSAGAATPSAAWNIESLAYPSDFSAKDSPVCLAQSPSLSFEWCDTYEVTATNVGAAETDGHAVTLSDVLPPGLTVRRIALFEEGVKTGEHEDLAEVEEDPEKKPGIKVCSPSPVRCVLSANVMKKVLGKASLPPDAALKMFISVLVNEPATEGALQNEATVQGGIESSEGTGGVPTEVTVRRPNTLESGRAAFGPSVFDAPLVGVDGQPLTQAGGHPDELLTKIGLNSAIRVTPEGPTQMTSVEDLRDAVVDLPVGMAGSGVMAPTCSLAQLASKGPKEEQGHSGCPTDTIVGHIRSYPEGLAAAIGPLFNIVPEQGYAAELGFIDSTGGTHVLYVTLASTPAGYVLRTTTREIPALRINEAIVSVFGDPAARDGSGETPVATFTNPEHCDGTPLTTTIHMDSWQAPGSYNADGSPKLNDPNWVTASFTSPAVSGCEALKGLFSPSIVATTSSARADSPTGLGVELKVPQHTGAESLATPPLRDTTITLPPGLTVNPSSANGLEACSLAQIGIGKEGLPDLKPPSCPDGSKLGTLEVETPALAMQTCKQSNIPLRDCPPEEVKQAPLTGSIYLAKQGENPFGSLIAIYIVVDDPRTGLIVKIPAKITPDRVTGQLTATVTDTPQFPFSVLRTNFFAGDTAALTAPLSCGSYPLTSVLTPWSSPQSGPPATPSASVKVSETAAGGVCEAPRFSPALSAGSTDSRAGTHSAFSVTFSRKDGEQQIAAASVETPAGLLGTIRGVPRCGEPQASQGQCSSESQLGEVTVAVGAGADPYWVHGGKVYLTGPYNGGPFGLSIVIPTTAGPFTLTGNGGLGREIVRASIRVDPHTARITVVSDPLPTIIEGIRLQVRTVNVTINRPNFIFNPTNCGALASEASFTSEEGTAATATSPFYASHCKSLAFNPVLTATSTAHTSRGNGASLTIRVAAKPGQANIGKTDLQLPAVLPARLSTLQKACLAAVFRTNPAQCPPASNVGRATVTTPVLNSAMSGPIYLVSFGNKEFPHTEIVLQGEGVTAVLDGHTDIKKGVTYSNFESIPDVPVSSFQAVLPAGPHSVFGAHLPESLHENICGTHYAVPTLIVAQNNKQVRQNTVIGISGCPTRPTVKNVAVHNSSVVLTIYTPVAGSLHVGGAGVVAKTVVAGRTRNERVVLHIRPHHSHSTSLTLTLTPRAERRRRTARVVVRL